MPLDRSAIEKNRRQGFTLVELLVVIVVFGIFATIAATRFIDASESAKRAAFLTDIHVIESIIQVYTIFRDHEPDSDPRLIEDPEDPEQPEEWWDDLRWNQYARDYLDEFIQGGWPVETPYGGVYSYRYYKDWEWIHLWKGVFASGDLSDRLDGSNTADIIMIRFIDGGDFAKAKEALRDSRYSHRVYRYEDWQSGSYVKQDVLGIFVR